MRTRIGLNEIICFKNKTIRGRNYLYLSVQWYQFFLQKKITDEDENRPEWDNLLFIRAKNKEINRTIKTCIVDNKWKLCVLWIGINGMIYNVESFNRYQLYELYRLSMCYIVPNSIFKVCYTNCWNCHKNMLGLIGSNGEKKMHSAYKQ